MISQTLHHVVEYVAGHSADNAADAINQSNCNKYQAQVPGCLSGYQSSPAQPLSVVRTMHWEPNMRMDQSHVIKLLLYRIPNICILRMSSHTHRQPRKQKRDLMILDEDVDTAEIVTFEEVTVTRKDGTTKTRKVTVPLFEAQLTLMAPPVTSEESINAGIHDIDMIGSPPDIEPDGVPVLALHSSKVSFTTFHWNKYKCSFCKKTQRDYILEFVQNIDSLLPDLLSQKALPIEDSKYDHCARDLWAIWRCKDWCLAKP